MYLRIQSSSAYLDNDFLLEGIVLNLLEQISQNTKEIFGSRTKNRFTVQVSYAMQLIMEFYSLDFLIMMDYIEDIAIIEDPDNNAKIRLYQIKTKSSGTSYTLNTVISERWFEKLYMTASQYGENLETAAVVCNTDIVQKQAIVFPNAITSLSELSVQNNINKIRTAIAKENSIPDSSVDLTNYYFIRSTLSTYNHKEQVEHEFESFLIGKEPSLQISVARSIYSLLYDELDKRFNCEINPKCTDNGEIFENKCVSIKAFKDLISTGLAIQLPDLDRLFSIFDIHSPLVKMKYSSAYTKIKMDMFSNSSGFIIMKEKLINAIYKEFEAGNESNSDVLDIVYKHAQECDEISEVYKNEYYMKIIIMLLVYKICNGGIINEVDN